MTFRTLLVAAAAAGLLATSTGCSFLELEMDAQLTDIGFPVGKPIRGTVDDQHGRVTVQLVPKAGKAVRCSYDDGEHRYSCPTTAAGEPLPLDRYDVRVTDHDEDYENPDGTDGTAVVNIPVVLTSTPGYNPAVGVVASDDHGVTYPREGYVTGTSGVPTVTGLRGWEPGSTVTVGVLDDTDRPLQTTKVRVGADGTASVTLAALPEGSYTVTVKDAVWDDSVVFLVDAPVTDGAGS